MTIAPIPDDVSVARAAKLAGLSPRQVWRVVASGRLPSEKVGAHRRIKRADIAAVAKKTLTRGEKKTDIGWSCQSSSSQPEIVRQIMQQLEPMVERLVGQHFGEER